METKKSLKTRFKRLYVSIRSLSRKWFMTVIMLVIFVAGIYHLGRWAFYHIKYAYHAYVLDDLYDLYNDSYRLNSTYRFYENGSHGYIRDERSGKKVLRDVAWIVESDGNDSLMCFASKGYRGYFNMNTGKVDIPADRYTKAWDFSEGFAAVMDEDSTIRFINPSGKVVIDIDFRYTPKCDKRPFVFREGYCAMVGSNGAWGLINNQGKWCVKPQYDYIKYNDKGFWTVWKDGRKGLMNDSLRLVLEPVFRDVVVDSYGLEALGEDYVRQLFAFDGTLIHDFTYTRVDDLVYKTGSEDEEQYDCKWELSPYKVYYTTYSTEDVDRAGLLGPDGKPITPPLYREIKAVSAYCFRCFFDYDCDGEGLSVLIDNKGKVIEPI